LLFNHLFTLKPQEFFFFLKVRYYLTQSLFKKLDLALKHSDLVVLFILFPSKLLYSLVLHLEILLVLIIFTCKLLSDLLSVYNLIVLQVSMVLQYVILELNVSLNLADVPLCIALSFLLVLVDLLIKLILNALLQ